MRIRTCIVCKTKMEQAVLTRWQNKDKEVVSFSGNGRSFYICKICLRDANLKKIKRSMYRGKRNIRSALEDNYSLDNIIKYKEDNLLKNEK